MPKRICAALMLALAVLATAGCAGTDRFQAQADVVAPTARSGQR